MIYSRHLLAILLGNWCDCDMITSELIDNSDEVQLIGLLDILQKLESKELFEKVRCYIRCMPSLQIQSYVGGGGEGEGGGRVGGVCAASITLCFGN